MVSTSSYVDERVMFDFHVTALCGQTSMMPNLKSVLEAEGERSGRTKPTLSRGPRVSVLIHAFLDQ